MRDCWLALFACALVGCLHPGARECSGETASLDVPTPRRLHVRVLLTRKGKHERHEVVVRAQRGTIEAVGLTPMGTQAYHLTHDQQGIEIENRIGRHLGLTPRLAYDAIARAYLSSAALAQPTGEALTEQPVCGYVARIVRLADEPLNRREPASPHPP